MNDDVLLNKGLFELVLITVMVSSLKHYYKLGEVHFIADWIEAGSDKLHFRQLFNNENGGVILVAFTEPSKRANSFLWGLMSPTEGAQGEVRNWNHLYSGE